MAQCDKFKMHFSEYLDGEFTLEGKKEMENHLTHCPECKETMRQIRIIQESIRQIPHITTSPDFEKRLHEQIFLPMNSVFPMTHMWQSWKYPAMGSAIVLATVGFFLIFSDSNTNTSVMKSGSVITQPAATQISAGNNTGYMNQPKSTYGGPASKTLIADSLRRDTTFIRREGIHIVDQGAQSQ